MKKIKLLGIIVTCSFLSPQAFAWTNSQQAADKLGAVSHKEMLFSKNSSSLNQAQKDELIQVMNEAKLKGKVIDVKLLVWSDKEYPQQNTTLGKADHQLAQNRVKSLKMFFKKDLDFTKVDSYNMSERPNSLQKLFNTSSTQIKNVTEMSGAAPSSENTGLFDQNAQASKAVVLFFIQK